jgi:hypothetical protein
MSKSYHAIIIGAGIIPVKRPHDPQFGIANDESLSGGVLFHAAGYISDPQLETHNIMRAAEQAGEVNQDSSFSVLG